VLSPSGEASPIYDCASTGRRFLVEGGKVVKYLERQWVTTTHGNTVPLTPGLERPSNKGVAADGQTAPAAERQNRYPRGGSPPKAAVPDNHRRRCNHR
jgi:hypothetical protein